MITVNNNIKNAYNQSTTQTDRIKLNGNYYYINNVEYSDDCYEEGNIFGTAIARILTFEIESSIPMEKKEFQYETGVLINGVFEFVSLGNFIVTETEEGDTTDITKVTAMDYMLKTNTTYETNLNYSTATLLDVLQEVCTNCGLYLATTTFTNSSFRVDSNQFEKNTLNRQVIQAVAQVSGCIAKIKADNRLYLINPNLIEDVSQVFTLKEYAEAEIKRLTHPLNLVSLANSQIEGENITMRDNQSIEHDGENSLIIYDNPFAYNQDKRTQLITPLFNAVKGFEYKSYSLKFQMLPWIETLDKIQFLDKEGNTYNSYVFRFTYKSPNGVESTIEAPSETRATIAYQNIPDALEIAKRTEIIVDKQNQVIESVVSEVTEQNNKISRVQQTVDELNSKISDIADITTSQETNTGSLTFEDINQSEPIHIEIVPLGDNISYLYPFEQLYPADNLYIKLRTLRFTNTETNEVFDYELPDDLLYYDNEHYDKFILDYDSQTCYVNKKCDYDNNGNVVCLASEVINSYTFPHINLTDGDYTVQILKYDGVPYGAYLFCRLMTQNIYTTQFATKAEVNSEISQTAQSIDLSVNQKLTNYSTTTQMNSAINMKANEITSSVNDTLSDYSTTTQMNSAINQKANQITSSVNSTLSNYSTTTQMNSAINQKASEINSTVSTKVGNDEIISKINQTSESVTIDANKISLNGKTLNLTGDNIVIESDHLDVDKYGNITITSDAATTMSDLSKLTIQTSNQSSIGKMFPNMLHYKTTNGSAAFGIFGWPLLTLKNPLSGEKIDMACSPSLEAVISLSSDNSSTQTIIERTGITTPRVIQTSKHEDKKNFEKFNNALGIIKSIDIYKYNLKEEQDNTKKHIGFVIGEDYKYSEEVTSNENNGVDLYSFVSLCCKAIQEQQAEIEELKKRLEEQSND